MLIIMSYYEDKFYNCIISEIFIEKWNNLGEKVGNSSGVVITCILMQ